MGKSKRRGSKTFPIQELFFSFLSLGFEGKICIRFASLEFVANQKAGRGVGRGWVEPAAGQLSWSLLRRLSQNIVFRYLVTRGPRRLKLSTITKALEKPRTSDFRVFKTSWMRAIVGHKKLKYIYRDFQLQERHIY